MWCTYADQADYLIIVARTTPYDPVHRHAGIRRFYVPKERGTFPPGVSGTPIRKIGYFGWQTWELSIDGLRVPPTTSWSARTLNRTTRRDFVGYRAR